MSFFNFLHDYQAFLCHYFMPNQIELVAYFLGQKKLDSLKMKSQDSSMLDEITAGFNPSEFFIPGWKGEGLISASAIVIKNMLNNLSIDAQILFKKSCSTSKSMKILAHNEFLHFLEYAKVDQELLKEQNDFWVHLQDETSPLKKHVDNFLKVHAFRAVAIYLFRIKFIVDLTKKQGLPLTEDILINPLSFLGKIFIKDSSTELLCDSLQINQYSWYRPSLEYKNSLLKLKDAFSDITLTELIKLISTPKNDKIYSIRNYSHSLSHLAFGLFVNNLLIQFPEWIKPSNKKKTPASEKLCPLPKTLKTRFVGNHVSSMALSHWLAQETNVPLSEWDQLICPDFDGTEFIDGQFLKICQELQFLSFLTRMAAIRHYEIIPFICKIMREKYKKSLHEEHVQPSFLNIGKLSLYNRIILNVTELPKTNPHHYLTQQIMAQKSMMANDGILYVFTNQKLFVPSHSDRIAQLFHELEIEAAFNMEDLLGKGEIAHYLYILSKKTASKTSEKHLFNAVRKTKQSLFSFEFNGNLAHFSRFKKLTGEFKKFMETKNPLATPLFLAETDDDTHFKFYQDAVIDGKLVSSTSGKDSPHIPHPSFFKNLIKNSAPLSMFFNMEVISHENLHPGKKNISNEYLGLTIKPEKNYPLLLIINQNDPMDVKLEFSPMEAYRSKLEKYGTAFHYYFGLTPKIPAINLNVFREYFSSPLGHQIIQLQLSDGMTKLKAKLKSLLVPGFFASTQFVPENIKQRFKLLDMEALELKKIHSLDLKEQFLKIKTELETYSAQYPWHLLSLLSHFKLQMHSLLETIEDNPTEAFNFNSPVVSNELLKLKTYPLYPKNNDLYIDYKIKTNLDLKLPLTSLVIKNNEEASCLILKFQEREIVHLHASLLMVHFIKFILQNAMGVKIADILANLKIPTANDLLKTMDQFENLKSINVLIVNETKEEISSILRKEISR